MTTPDEREWLRALAVSNIKAEYAKKFAYLRFKLFIVSCALIVTTIWLLRFK